MRMTRIECPGRELAALARLDRDAQCPWHASDTVVRERDDQFGSTVPLALPDPGGTHAITDSPAQGIECCRPAFEVASKVVGLRPERPVVATKVEHVQQLMLDHVDAGGVDGIVRADRSGSACGSHPP